VPNPTTSKSFDLHQHERASPVDVAEGRRLLAEVTSLPWRTAATDDTCVVDADNEEVCALAGNYGSQDEWPQMEARAALIVFAVNHLPALLSAARQAERMRKALEELSEKLDAARRPEVDGDPAADAQKYWEIICDTFEIAEVALSTRTALARAGAT